MFRIRIAIVACSLVAVLAADVAALAVLSDRRVEVAVTPGADGDRLVLRSGDTDLPGLARAASEVGRPELVEGGPQAYLLTVPLTVVRGARLRVDGTDLRLLSTPSRVADIEIRGGLSITRSTVTSWDATQDRPDLELADGRAYLVARAGGRLGIVDSTMTMLGYDHFGRYGVTWRGRGTAGEVSRSNFISNHHGAYIHDVDGMVVREARFEESSRHGLDVHTSSIGVRIEASVFRRNQGHGLVVAVDSSDAHVTGNEVADNGEHGMAIFSGSNGVLLEHNRSYNNGKSGVVLSGVAQARVVENDVSGNQTGIGVQDGAQVADFHRNRIHGNTGDGVRISSSTSSAVLTGNEVVSNVAAGIFVDDGSVELRPGNRLASNSSGIKIDDGEPQVRVVGSTLEHNHDDGLSVRRASGVTLQSNKFWGNGKAALSSADPADGPSLLEGNEVGPHPVGPTRLRRPRA